MSPAIITLIAWAPFLLLALIFGIVFTRLGFERGSARAGISIGVTALSCFLSVVLAKVLSGALAGAITPMFKDMLGSSGMKQITSLASGLASALSALVIYIPIFILLTSVLKPVAYVIFKKIIPQPKHIADRIGGITVSLADALLVAFLGLIPLYGTLCLAGGVVDIIDDGEEEMMEYVSAATDPFIVDVAGVPPFSTVYDSLMSCELNGKTVSVSATVRQAAAVISDINALGDLKTADISEKDLAKLLNSAEKLLLSNDLFTDFVCEELADEIPAIKIPGVGKIELKEYYTALSEPEQLRNDIPAVFDLVEGLAKSGMLEALSSKDKDMSMVDAKEMSKTFGNTLNHSQSISAFKSKIIKDLVNALSEDMIGDGKDENGAVAALRDAIASMPETPLSAGDAVKEGEAIYLLLSGALSGASEGSDQGQSLGMMIEGLARHPSVGVDKVVDAAGTLISGSGMTVSDKLMESVESNLRSSLDMPIGESTFPEYCATAFDAVDALGGIAEGNADTESLKNLITATPESLEAVKESVSSELMTELGMSDEQSETMQKIIDTTFDAIIGVGCTEEEAEKEAEALGNILEILTDVSESPENADEIFTDEAVNDMIDNCVNSKVINSVLSDLTKDEESDPLGVFGEMDNATKETIENKIEEYIGENGENETLDALKLLIGISE